MQVLIDIDEDKIAELKMAVPSAQIVGTEQDLLLYTVFGKEDIELFLQDKIENLNFEEKEKPFVQNLLNDQKSFDKLIDDVFAQIDRSFDANIGITNDLIDFNLDQVFKAHARMFQRSRNEKIER